MAIVNGQPHTEREAATMARKTLYKVTLRDVKRSIRDKGKWSGYMAGNRVAPRHIMDGWCLGPPVEFSSLEELEETQNHFLSFLDRELGTYCAWYEVR